MIRRLRSLALLASATTAATAVALSVTAAPASAAEDYGPYTCRQGYVWREAVPGDKVCVTPAVREQTRKDNALAAKRRRPGGGPYGFYTCRQGYVWREAVPGDKVCVTPATRTQARKDNAAASSRWVSAKIWLTRYVDPSGAKPTPFIQLNGSHFNYGKVRVYLKYYGGQTAVARIVTAKHHDGFAGGSWAVKTKLYDCSRPGLAPNAYAQAYDELSGRWSAKLPLRTGCIPK